MSLNVRKFAVFSVFAALVLAACGTPPPAPVAPATTVAVATEAATVAAPTTEATEAATIAPTEAMTATVEATEEATAAATEAITATVEATEVMTGTAAATTGTVTATTVATGTAVAEVTINVGTSSLGEILTDAAGRTLYIFKNDTAGSSTCYEGCAQNWPPVLTTGTAQAGTDIDSSLLGTTERTDGTTQVTYNDMPLYFFARDTASGDVNGQGVGEVWYVVSPAGEMIER